MYALCKIISLFLLATIASGGTPYNLSQICCNGTVLPYNDSDEIRSQCCGNQLRSFQSSLEYDEDAIIPLCCDNVLHEEPDSKYSQCCGTELYDVRVQVCFNYSNVITIPSEHLAKNETEACGINKDNLIFYNPIKELCCSGKLHEYKEDFSCCGEVSYNYSTSLCCSPNQVTDVGNATYKRCCGDRYYDSTEATCCYISNKLEDGTYESVEVITSYNGKKPQDSSCCGLEIYNYMEEICCPDGPIGKPNQSESYKCCGGGLITWDQLCVDGKGQDKTESDEDVCGDSTVYRTSESFCYKNALIKHKENEDLCSNGELYDRTTQICYKNSIFPLTAEEIKENKVYYCEVDQYNY